MKNFFKYQSIGIEFIAGLTVFCAMSYVMIANTFILASAGMPAIPVFLGTCLIAGIGSILCGLIVKTPTAIAPAMGINMLIVTYLQETNTHWSFGLWICFFTSILFFLISASGLRQELLKSLPQTFKSAIRSGIGALLIGLSISMLKENESFFNCLYQDPSILKDEMKFRTGLFIFGISVIFICQSYLKNLVLKEEELEQNKKRSFAQNALLTFCDLSPLLVVISTILIYSTHSNLVLNPLSDGNVYEGLRNGLSYAPKTFADACMLIGLIMVMLSILVSDIAGSPFDILDTKPFDKTDAAEKEKTVRRSLKFDSLLNIFSPFFATTPAIYYAENHSAEIAGGRTGLTAIVTGILFLISGGIGYWAINNGVSLSDYHIVISPLSVAPLLFYTGMIIVTHSMHSIDPEDKVRPHMDYMPAAVTAIVTPLLNFEFALMLGLGVFLLVTLSRKGHVDKIVMAFFALLLVASLPRLFLAGGHEQTPTEISAAASADGNPVIQSEKKTSCPKVPENE